MGTIWGQEEEEGEGEGAAVWGGEEKILTGCNHHQ